MRNLEHINKGMLINTAWRSVHDPKSFVAKIIRSKYYSRIVCLLTYEWNGTTTCMYI